MSKNTYMFYSSKTLFTINRWFDAPKLKINIIFSKIVKIIKETMLCNEKIYQ